MCVYNDERFVGHAIQSVLAQSFQEFELVIINDGSTDGTQAVLDEYARRDSRIRVYRQENAGTTAAANFGLSVVCGKFVARLDSDDLSYPHRLQLEAEFLERNPSVALVGGGSHIIDVDGAVIGVRNISTAAPARTLRHRCIYQQSDVMFRRDVVARLGGYRDKFRNAQDYDLWLRVSEVAQIAKLDDILGQWRLNRGGYTLSRAQEQRREAGMVKHFARQRRKHCNDDYEKYSPPQAHTHRKNIARDEYDFIVGAVFLQALRIHDARRKYRGCLAQYRTARALLMYLLTFFPKRMLGAAFRMRDFYLNTLG
jgi:glycosyltransferase involved in cell wall biosynthesis